MRPTHPILGGALACLLLAASSSGHAQTVFAGFEHQPTGAAALSVAPDFSSLNIDNLTSSGGGVTYQLDAEAGSITFGDGISGARPSTGGWNVQGNYRYGGGTTGSISANATVDHLDLVFDFTPLTTAAVAGVVSVLTIPQVDMQFPPSTELLMQQWPDEIAFHIDDGELVLTARWESPVSVVLPDDKAVLCDEAVFRSQTGGALNGEEFGPMSWDGFDLDRVEILGERFREQGHWYEIAGNFRLNRTVEGHELTHVEQQGPAGTARVQPPDPCLQPGGPVTRQSNGVAIEEMVLQVEPEVGTRINFLNYMRLPDESLARIPSHSAEWTDHAGSDPGMTLTGGFLELGAETYTVQVFDDGLLVDQATGLSGAVARAKEYVVQHTQTDLDFLSERAAAQIDLGRDVEITLLTSVPRQVVGDRVHIIPEQLEVFPDCVEAVEAEYVRFQQLVLKRGAQGVVVPPARVFGLAHQATGDGVLALQDGHLRVSNESWGPGATGQLAGGVRTPVAGLEGFGWEFAGDLDPTSLPPDAEKLIRLRSTTSSGAEVFGGLNVGIQNGQFAIKADFAALGSPDAQVDAWLGSQPVYSGVVPSHAAILSARDFNEVRFTEDENGTIAFDLHWGTPQTLIIDGQPVTATRVSERLRHRHRAITIWDYERLALGGFSTEVHKASVRRHTGWMTAVGDVDLGDPASDPLVIQHLNSVAQSGVEVEAEPDHQGQYHFLLEIAGPGSSNILDGDETVTLLIQEADDIPAARRAPIAPGTVTFERAGSEWNVVLDFAASGYSGFRVLTDGSHELFDSTGPTGLAATCEGWPTTQLVKGVGDELWIRLGFETPTAVSAPGSGRVTTEWLTLIVSGASHPPFPGGSVQVLSEGLENTVLFNSPVVVSAPAPGLPDFERGVVLYPAAPNPFNPNTLIRYALSGPMRVELSVYDLAGRRVAQLINQDQDGPASYEAVWNGADDAGRSVASGVYLFRLSTPSYSEVRKMTLVK